jgi:8-hydroxy-5-deazaflavin:NADPH oxidoreductase
VKIGIIGAGNIGGNLTRRFAGLGHEVSVANSRDPETLWELANETGANTVWANDAAKGAEILVVTIPEKNIPDLPAGVLDGLASGAVVIDTGNYYPSSATARSTTSRTAPPKVGGWRTISATRS